MKGSQACFSKVQKKIALEIDAMEKMVFISQQMAGRHGAPPVRYAHAREYTYCSLPDAASAERGTLVVRL